MKVEFETAEGIFSRRFFNEDDKNKVLEIERSIIKKVTQKIIELPYQPQIGMLLTFNDLSDLFSFTKKENEYLSDALMEVDQIFMCSDRLLIFLAIYEQ